MWVIQTILGAEPILAPGAAGWLTAITSAVLLGPVLYWLMMYHLPAKDKLMLDLFQLHLNHIEKLRKEQEEKILIAIAAFKEEARIAAADRERQTTKLIETIKSRGHQS